MCLTLARLFSDPEQKYDAHHDWGVDPPTASHSAPSRFITLLLYLNDPVAGGQTAFPKATDATTGKQIAIHPGKVATPPTCADLSCACVLLLALLGLAARWAANISWLLPNDRVSLAVVACRCSRGRRCYSITSLKTGMPT